MWGEFHEKRERLLLLMTLLLGLSIRLWIAWQPISTLLMKSLTDDAYYYFMIARNTVKLGSVSFDGINPTNGFHPLWWILLLPIFGFPESVGDFHVNLALSLACFLDVVAIWAIIQIVTTLSRRTILGIVAGLIYALNPMVILQVANGLETSLGMATLCLYWLAYLRWLSKRGNLSQSILVGVLAGIMLLARTDSIFFFGLSMLGALWFWKRSRTWRPVVTVCSVVFVILVPWLLWSRLSVGSWLQESGTAVPMAIRIRFALEQGGGLLPTLKESFRQLFHPELWLRGDPTGLPFLPGVFLWVVLIIGIVIRWVRRRDDLEVAVIVPMIGASMLLTIFHAGIRWYPRPWYFIPAAAAFSVGTAILATQLQLSRKWMLAGLGTLLYFAFSAAVFWQVGFYPWQREMRQASVWIDQNIPRSSTVGSFNAGIYAFYSGKRVVGLDGVVNHAAFEAIKSRDVLHYLQMNDIEFLVDYDSAIKREYAVFMGPGYPEELNEIAILGGQEDMPLGLLRAYRIVQAP